MYHEYEASDEYLENDDYDTLEREAAELDAYEAAREAAYQRDGDDLAALTLDDLCRQAKRVRLDPNRFLLLAGLTMDQRRLALVAAVRAERARLMPMA